MRKKFSAIKLNWFVIALLLLGVLFKLFVTSNGNIIFHMDSARDFVDVREMVELMKPRLIGQTSGIEGFYNGPGWYYLLAIPYILFDGDPYGGVVLMIVMWAIGGYFLYLVTRKYGFFAWFSSLLVWFASPYISLSTVYSFNPHPIIYLTPLFVYILEKYIITEKVWYGVFAAVLSALFFQWEMNTGVFNPLIIIGTIVLARKYHLFKSKGFWISIVVFMSFFLPQLLFDLKHDFIMSNAVLRFLGEGGANSMTFGAKFDNTWNVFFGAFVPTLLNNALLVKSILILFGLVSILSIIRYKKSLLHHIDLPLTISLLTIIIPFIGYLLLPVNIHPWHMVAVVSSTIIVTAYLVSNLKKRFPVGWGLIVVYFVFCFMSIWQGVGNGFREHGQVSGDPSNLRNELNAIDYAYSQADGKNFKAYAYLPSIIDFPYQYLFWWYGLKEYGYTPTEYFYLPEKPEYISNKDKFNQPKKDAKDSELIILVKEPDRIKMRHLWEGNFQKYPLLDQKMIGPLEVETRTSL
jgi:hypothetical protein